MDHMLRCGNEVYDGTLLEDLWDLQHDNLSSWMKSLGGRAYLIAMGFEHRRIRNYGANYGDAYYGFMMVGDSSGLNRCTDSYGFAHMMRLLWFNAALSKPFWNHPVLGALVFNTGTAAGMFSCMDRAWSSIPGQCFIDDVKGFDRYLLTVIKVDGTYVPDMETRSGRRYEAMRQLQEEAEGDEACVVYLERKPRSRQRKETLCSSEPHSDLTPIVAILLKEDMELEAGASSSTD